MNKYKTRKALCTICMCLLCTSVFANQKIKPVYYQNIFLGISFDHNDFSSPINESIDSTYYLFTYNNYKVWGYSIIGGKRWGHVGLQIGYSFLPTAKESFYNINSTFKHYNQFADALFFYPINELCDLKSLLGIGLMHSKISGYYVTEYPTTTNYFNLSRNQFSPRFGLGAEYKIRANVNMDVMAKYQRVSFLYRNDIIISVGVFYHL